MTLERVRTRLEHELDTRSVATAVWAYRRTRGRLTRLWGRRAIVLTTTGARSGLPRTVLVQVFPDGQDLFVVAANSGLGRPPGWYHNLRAHPRFEAELDGAHLRLRADLLPEPEATARWQRVLATAPDYARYARRTGVIPPTFRLRATDEQDHGARNPRDAAPTTTGVPGRRPVVALATAAVALSAYAGAVGLATGTDPYLQHLTPRLPLRSPALGGLALTAVVAVPHTVAARDAWRGRPRSDTSAIVAGALLCGWLLTEAAVLRETSSLDALYGAAGAALVAAGLTGRVHARKEPAPWPPA